MKEFPPGLIQKIDLFIENYKDTKEKLPNQAIINSEVYGILNNKDERMLIPEKNGRANGSYTGHILNNNYNIKITIYMFEKLSEKKQAELEQLIKDIQLPLILCRAGIKKFNDPLAYDLSWDLEDLILSPK